MAKYVIIGNSAAAIGTVEGIRRVDTKGEIILISSEPHFTYSRPLISYLLWGKTDREKMKYRPDTFYRDNNVTALLGETVTKINSEKKCVSTDSGKCIEYDKLMVATGSRPFVPPMKGIEKVEKKFNFMTLDDATSLEKELGKDKNVLIIGAGLIGLKCAEGIFEKVGSVSVVDLANRILPSILDARASEIMKSYLEKKGIHFYLNNSAKEFTGEKEVTLNDGTELNFDILVVAVGVRPNTELLKDIGAQTDRGVLIDEHCKTTLPDIYCAGDCSQGYDISADSKRILALLPNAYMQGECAGKNMAGENTSYSCAIPMNAMGMFGYHIVSAGTYDGDEYTEENGENYKHLFYKDGVLKGFIIMGDIKRAGIYTDLIRKKTPLEELDFDLIKKKPQLLAFCAQARQAKLAEIER